MLKAIKVRLYLNQNHISYINNLFGSSRFVYNQLLAYKTSVYKDTNKSISFSDLGKQLTNLKSSYSWLKDVHSKVLQQSMIDLDKAYTNFFKYNTGYPTYKSKHSKQSCRFPVDAIGNIKGNRINIIRPLFNIHFKCSKSDEIYINHNKNLIKSATLSKTKCNQCYLSILIDKPNNKILPQTSNMVGIDIGIKDFIITSDGIKYDNIKIKRNNKHKLRKLNQRLSRKVKGSKNKDKARLILAKYHQKLNNKKEYYLHKISNELLNENQMIVMENLNVKGIMANHKLAKSIQELSINRFQNILDYKSNWYGRDVIYIDRWFPSSKLCSNCGYKNDLLTLKHREWECPSCLTFHDRDINASVNILTEGLRNKIGLSSPELTPLER